MKISKLFHWLYAILMLIPFVSVFAVWTIYTWNPNVEIPTITENVSLEVDFNQLVPNLNDGSVGGVSYTYSDGYVTMRGTLSSQGSFNLVTLDRFTLGHKYYLKGVPSGAQSWVTYAYQYNIGGSQIDHDSIITYGGSYVGNLTFNVYSGVSIDVVFCPQVYDLTQMFGEGNEPSISDFDVWYPNDYYEFVLSRHEVIDNYSTRQVYDMPINHIWLPSFGGVGWSIRNVLNFGMTNLFGISTSTGLGYLIINLMSYWLCISLIWLIYDVIMYVPLMIHRWLDKGVIS